MNVKSIATTEKMSETIGILTAISIVSKRLARNLRKLEEQAESKEAKDNARSN